MLNFIFTIHLNVKYYKKCTYFYNISWQLSIFQGLNNYGVYLNILYLPVAVHITL